MSSRVRRLLLLCACVMTLCCLYGLSANAYSYPSMPSNWQDVRVTVGNVTMPFERYPSGATYDGDKRYMTVEEQKDYGFSVGGDLDLRGWQCVSFARYTYAALFYKYPQDAAIDTTLGYSYTTSYAYRNMIEETLGTKTLEGGYSADTLKTLITSCQPGAVARVGGHSFVIMAIYNDGFLVYDANFSNTNEVNVRAYTWQSFVDDLGSRTMTALHMPVYYPGYTYSTAGSTPSSPSSYTVDTSTAGEYEVYNCSTLNIRSTPSTSGTRVGSLDAGDVVTVLGSYNGWAQIQYGTAYYWVSMSYLKAYTGQVTVTFNPNGGTADFTTRSYSAGIGFGTMPTATKTGRTLVGWTDGNQTYTASSIVPAAATLALKAQWVILEYKDVPEDAWFAPYVEDAYSKGLISYDTAFNPDQIASRGMLVTVLGREYERETGTKIDHNGVTIFTDVPQNFYYAKYVGWGNANGIVLGMGDNTFGPNDPVTREQMAVFLYRLAVYTNLTSKQDADLTLLSRFKDGSKVSSYAKEAMCWAVEAGIFQGDDTGSLNPQSSSRRSEMITVLSRYIDYRNTVLSKQKVSVQFDAAGGDVETDSASYTAGTRFGNLPTPSKENRTFEGWYDGDTLYTDDSVVPETGVTLTAVWKVLGYSDVSEDDWYVAALEQAAALGILPAEDTFAPETEVTGALLAEYLGQTAVKLLNQEITDPTAWAVESGLVTQEQLTMTLTPDEIVASRNALAALAGLEPLDALSQNEAAFTKADLLVLMTDLLA